MKRWYAWASVVLLVVLCAVVAVLQYRWIGEISEAERERLQEQLHTELNALHNSFSERIRDATTALQASTGEVERLGREEAYSARYRLWQRAGRPLFQRIALAVPRNGSLEFESLDLASGQFARTPWPREWSRLQERLLSHLGGGPVPPGSQPEGLLELPRFAGEPEEGPREQEWLIAELSLDYIRTTVMPELLKRYLGGSGRLDYDTAVSERGIPIFESSPAALARIGRQADASVALGSGGPPGPGFRGSPGGTPPRREPPPRERSQPPEPPGGRMSRPMMGGGPAWTLAVRHKAGSLEALVERARRRNLALSGGLLLLIIATVTVLVRFSRQSQRLAELQINFVAGVSHELRTPLTVIRTAAYNLRGRMAERPEQVERYGQLIQDESKKLDAQIDQVLRFASAKAGHAIRRREPVCVEELIEKALQSAEPATRQAGVLVEKRIEGHLPRVLADELAMGHALQNLIDNALKYGAEGGKWLGVSASAVADGVEICIADHGPGVPADEQGHIFDPFFRGRRAVSDQIHGTGLGLHLVKNIVVAHGGTLQVKSAAGKRTEFVMRIPAA
jgi:signal transduction histidine kinase